MARVIQYLNLVTLLMLLNFAFLTSARPLSVLNIVSCPDANNELFDRFFLGSIKDGPSPGIGHGFENKAPLGGIKFEASSEVEHGYQPGGMIDGPRHGAGNELTAVQTLGGIKDGPSPGIGHKTIDVDVESLGGRKNSGPSPGAGH